MDASGSVTPVSRPGGVTAAAVVAVIGSLIVVAVAAFLASAPLPSPPPPNMNYRAFMIGMSLFLAALAGLGVWTAIGLFRLRAWARMSILAFAVIMTVMACLGLIFTLTVPIPVPPGKDPRVARAVLPGMIMTYSIPLLIGAWWIIQFTRKPTKAAFAAGGAAMESVRPLSISIIGWMHLIGGLFTPLFAVVGFPMQVGVAVLTGWKAWAAFLILGTVSIYIGWGLLRLNEKARRVAIGYLALTWTHGFLVSAVPSMRDKMAEIQASIRPPGSPPLPNPGDTGTTMIVFSLVFGLVIAGGMIWFLIRNKAAFNKEIIPDDAAG